MGMVDPRSFPKRWGRLVSEGNAKGALNLYTKNAVLIPTYGSSILQGHKELSGYFGQFMGRPNLRVLITDIVMRRTGPTPVVSGFYTFTWGKGGPSERAAARYTYVLEPARNKNGDLDWKIITHHSSVVP
jgi:hypothetical protein